MNNTRSEDLSETRVALKNVGAIDPEKIDDYVAAGGYRTFETILKRPREEIIDELVKASLRGRGGAGFSAGLKERFTSDALAQGGSAYLVCNADEGEPGTFKDRIIMENDPHLLVEGMLIAMYAIGARRAYIYVRAEYYRSIECLELALRSAAEGGYFSLADGLTMEIDLKIGAGSYLCGEELTLLESIEGKRGFPRVKPPFPAEYGLFGRPTLVNNVETLATIPTIVEKGSEWYRHLGTEDTPGTKIFTLSGDVAKPGYYEVEIGTTVRELVYHFGGGIEGGKSLQAVLLGGAAGTFVDESVLDIPTGYDSLKEKGAVIGSGAIVVLAEDRSIPDMLRSILRFFKHESCGKCVPCRVGTAKLVQMIDSGASLDDMVAEAEYIDKTSLCPLGQSPILPLRSLQKFFRSKFGGTP